MAKFYNNDPKRLRQLGDRAIVAGFDALAAECFAAAINLQPETTGEIVRSLVAGGHLQIDQSPGAGRLRLLDVLPPRSEPMRQAAVMLIDRPNLDPEFLRAASERIVCSAETAAERADCEVLLARIAMRLEEPAGALQRYKNAIWLQPAEVRYRLPMIELLDSLGRTREADAAIREALPKVDDRATLEKMIRDREDTPNP